MLVVIMTMGMQNPIPVRITHSLHTIVEMTAFPNRLREYLANFCYTTIAASNRSTENSGQSSPITVEGAPSVSNRIPKSPFREGAASDTNRPSDTPR